MRNIFYKIIVFSALFASINACDLDTGSERLLVQASGTPGEIILVMDSVQWKGELGDAMRDALEQYLPGVSRPEKLFTVRYIEPTLFNSVLNKARNIVFVATLDSKTQGGQTVRNFMTKNYIQENPDKFIISQRDIYASGQEALYLFSATEAELIEKVRNNKRTIVNFFNEKEETRLLRALYIAKEEVSVNEYMYKKHDCYIRVPLGYRIEADDNEFMWLRNVGEIDKNIFITYRQYTSEDIFKNSNLIGLRDSITRYNILEDPENLESYTKVDTMNIQTEFITTEIDGNFAKRIRGIWKTNTLTLGGSFVSYVFVDEESNRLYYIDGFVVSPGRAKREALRELEVMIKTFTTKSPLKEKEKA